MPKDSLRPGLELRQFARQMRITQNDCEQLLWRNLRARQLAGMKFRRQFACTPYVLDFYCPELKLAIELDGDHHFLPRQLVHDSRRTLYLQERGIAVVRFNNLQVMHEMDAVMAQILHAINQAQAAMPAKPLTP